MVHRQQELVVALVNTLFLHFIISQRTSKKITIMFIFGEEDSIEKVLLNFTP
jgi:hypothetical protein